MTATANRPFIAVNGQRYLPDASYFDGIDMQAKVPLVPFGSVHVPEQFQSEGAAIRHGEWWASRGDGRPRDGWEGVPVGDFKVVVGEAADEPEPEPEPTPQPAPEPEPTPAGFTLRRISIAGGETVVAEVDAARVRFRMGDHVKVEGEAPFHLFGDKGSDPIPGKITGTVTAEAMDASGSVIATASL